jgi:hypothetical protein
MITQQKVLEHFFPHSMDWTQKPPTLMKPKAGHLLVAKKILAVERDPVRALALALNELDKIIKYAQEGA